MEYLDFTLTIRPEGDAWRVVATSPNGEGASHGFSLPTAEWERLLHANAVLRDGRPVLLSDVVFARNDAEKEYGRSLFDAVFGGGVGALFRASHAAARALDKGLRLRLAAEGAALEVPWEFLCEPPPEEFVALSWLLPFVRTSGAPRENEPLRSRLPLQVLVVSASPAGLAPLAVQEELERLKEEVGDGLLLLQEATFEKLQDALKLRPYHIFHFIGHGRFDEQRNVGEILLQDERGGAAPLTADGLAQLLYNARTWHGMLRLCVLNCCESAQTSQQRPLAGVTQKLIERGMPAVVAMQFAISDRAAIDFAARLYDELARGTPLDLGVNKAREKLFSLRQRDARVEWATPVLSMQTRDGWILPRESTHAPKAHLSIGHDGVYGVAFSPDGRRAASVNGYGLRIWDLEKKLLVWSRGAPGHGSVVFSADGRTLVTAGGASPLRLWPADPDASLRQGRTVRGESTHVNDAALSPDGRLVSTVRGGALLRWDARKGTPVTPPSAGGTVRTLASWQDARTVIGGGGAEGEPVAPTLEVLGREDGICEVWRNGRRTFMAAPHARGVVAIKLSQDGKTATSVDDGGAVRRWDVATGTTSKSWEIKAGALETVSFGTDDLLVFTIKRPDNNPAPFYSLDLATGEEAKHEVDVVRAWASPDGRRALCASWNGLLLWDLSSARVVFRARGAMGRLGVAITSEGHVVVPAEGGISGWDVTRGKRLWFAPRSAAWWAASREGALVLVTSYDGDLRVIDTTTGRERVAFQPVHPEVKVVAVSRDGKVALSASPNEVRLWDVATGRARWIKPWDRGRITCAALDREGAKAAVGTEKGLVAVWSENGWRDVPTTATGSTPAITTLAWSPVGSTLAVGDWSGLLALWEATSQAPDAMRVLQERADFCVWAAVWSDDGKTLLTGTFNGLLTQWDMAAGGRPTQPIGPIDARVDALALSPGGRWAASCHGDDGTVRLWDLAKGEPPLGVLVTFMKGEWVAVDSRGGYSASEFGVYDEAGTPCVALRVGDELAAADGESEHDEFRVALPE